MNNADKIAHPELSELAGQIGQFVNGMYQFEDKFNPSPSNFFKIARTISERCLQNDRRIRFTDCPEKTDQMPASPGVECSSNLINLIRNCFLFFSFFFLFFFFFFWGGGGGCRLMAAFHRFLPYSSYTHYGLRSVFISGIMKITSIYWC